MSKRFQVLVTPVFERRYRKLLAHDKDLQGFFGDTLKKLEVNPQRGGQIKKLVGVATGDGAWRIRLGIYRLRYDVLGDTVVLHTIGLRKDIYR